MQTTFKWRYIALVASSIVLIVVAFAFSKSAASGDWPLLVFTIAANLASAMIGFVAALAVYKSDERADSTKQLLDIVVKPLQDSIAGAKSSPITVDEIRTVISDTAVAPILRRISEGRSPLCLFEVDWSSLIRESQKIDFVVQGWERWPERQKSALVQFFKAGGIFNLYITDPDSTRASTAHGAMAQRLAKTPAAVIEEIQDTREALSDLAKAHATNPQAAFNCFLIRDINWYFGARFASSLKAPDRLVFSVYSHHKRGTSAKSLPCMIFSADANETVADWFSDELKYFVDNHNVNQARR